LPPLNNALTVNFFRRIGVASMNRHVDVCGSINVPKHATLIHEVRHEIDFLLQLFLNTFQQQAHLLTRGTICAIGRRDGELARGAR
jgi:hypothetical protein